MFNTLLFFSKYKLQLQDKSMLRNQLFIIFHPECCYCRNHCCHKIVAPISMGSYHHPSSLTSYPHVGLRLYPWLEAGHCQEAARGDEGGGQGLYKDNRDWVLMNHPVTKLPYLHTLLVTNALSNKKLASFFEDTLNLCYAIFLCPLDVVWLGN